MEYLKHDRTIIKPLELDYVFPNHKLAIEINDIGSHYYPMKKRNYHYTKYNLALDSGYNLWTIWQWQLCYKQEIIASMLRAKLKIPTKKTYARNCNIIPVSSAQARQWYNETHLQGFCPATTHTSLQCDGEIVAMMSWRRGVSESELTRFSCALNTHVVGGFSKLFTHTRPDGKLYTFSFNDYSNGDLYSKNGWTYTGDVPPRYWWVKKNGQQVLSRRACQKKKIIQKFKLPNDYSMKSEFEIMTSLGFVQIFDSGKKRWEYAS